MSVAFLAQASAEAASTTWLEIAAGVAVPTAAAVLTVSVGIWTYTRQQQARRRERLRDLFSDALRAVADYQELPYLIRRRSDESPMKPSELVRHVSDIQTRLDYYIARLRLESREVGEAYERLVSVTRRESGSQMTEAWHQARLTGDADIPLGARYTRDLSDVEQATCITVMHNHLGG